MDWALVVVLQVMFQPSLSVLFTVEAEQSMYESEFGGDVVMGCRFQPKLSNPHGDLKVSWHRITPSAQKIYWMDNGTEHLAFQDPDYLGRVSLRTEELKDGWAKLQVSRLRISDAGTYQCLVQTEEGADYKTITLSVIAPYKAVIKQIQKTAEGNWVLLTCQSEGYPKSSVTWEDGHLRQLNPNTTAILTADQLFSVTSWIRVQLSDKNNYTCYFTYDGHSATFHIPDEIPIPPVKNDALIVIMSMGVIMVVITAAVFMYRRRKVSSNLSTRNILVNDQARSVSADAFLQVHKENEEEKTIFNEDAGKVLNKPLRKDKFSGMEENLGAFVKAHYSDFVFSAETRSHSNSFGLKELPLRLQNNKGHPVNLQALLPEAGETIFLEGPPGSGKTTIAHILVSSWTEGPTHALSNLLDLSILRLLLYVDCSKVKGDLFLEITSQLALTEKISTEDELRTVLSGSSKALLLLDGYREGNQFFDESLSRFLSQRGGCRLLVMACPGHCPTLRGTVETGGLLKLQTQTVKY